MGRETQDKSDEHEVKVTVGRDHDSGKETTDFIVVDRTSSTGSHDHIVIDEDGKDVHHGSKENK